MMHNAYVTRDKGKTSDYLILKIAVVQIKTRTQTHFKFVNKCENFFSKYSSFRSIIPIGKQFLISMETRAIVSSL